MAPWIKNTCYGISEDLSSIKSHVFRKKPIVTLELEAVEIGIPEAELTDCQ